ncbi:MAG: hypothetical protein QOF01_4428 [Thermomicrobiales bacterium]|nr:hypothetical protein [Thermomicrobiales bacterium]MEA2597959.1 hypothetical protein [Thermomicrobiales bacterium]
MPGGLTPWLADGLARLGTTEPFGAACRLLAHFTGTRVAEATARRLTEAAGAAWVQLELAATARLEADPGGAGAASPSGGDIQQLSVDGVFAPIVGGEWREVKLVTIGEIEGEAGEHVHTTDLSYFARMADHEAFGRQALGELHRRGTLDAPTVVAVADGAAWIQGVVDLHRPDAVRVLDFAHAVGYLAGAAQEATGAGTAATSEWLATWAHELRHGDPDRVLTALAALPAGEARDEAVRYLGARRDQIRYAAFAAAGYPLGSGCAESGAKTVVQARLCGAGMRWAPEHVDPMLGLRTVLCGGRWEEAWPRIATQLRAQARLAGATRRAARLARTTPPPALPPPEPGPEPPPPAPVTVPAPPKRVVDGRPTADHPWKRRLLAGRPPEVTPPALRKL